MLHCLITDEKKKIFGADHHRIPELMIRGQELIKNRGEFETNMNDTMHIVGTQYQTPYQILYASQYGSYFVVGERTDGCNQCGLTISMGQHRLS